MSVTMIATFNESAKVAATLLWSLKEDGTALDMKGGLE